MIVRGGWRRLVYQLGRLRGSSNTWKGLWCRGLYGHDGWVASLDDRFNPARVRDDFASSGFKGYKRDPSGGSGTLVRTDAVRDVLSYSVQGVVSLDTERPVPRQGIALPTSGTTAQEGRTGVRQEEPGQGAGRP